MPKGGLGRSIRTFHDSPTAYAKDVNRLISSRITSGKILFQDDMEGEVLRRWVAYGAGSLAKGTTVAFNGDQSLAIITPAVAYGNQEAYRLIGNIQNVKKYGFEFYFSAPLTSIDRFFFGMEYRHRELGIRDQAQISIYPVAKAKYINQAGVSVNFPAGSDVPSNVDFADTLTCWHHVQLIIDVELREYVRFILDSHEVDMRGIRMYDYSATPSNYNMFEVYLYFTPKVAASITGLIDDVVVTEEP